MRKKISCVVGTRPEAIKMAPVIIDLKKRDWCHVQVICTSQHRDTVYPIFDYFGISVDIDLDVMKPNQNLCGLTTNLSRELSRTIEIEKPDAVLAQGDTTSVFVTALTCFYQSIPFGHVEAGLRSGDLYNPYPEEFNRIASDILARWHFIPTRTGYENLVRELNRSDCLYVTGNTVIDALLMAIGSDIKLPVQINEKADLLLVTLHRRESHGKILQGILASIVDLVETEKNLEIILPVHPNPNVSSMVHDMLGGHRRIHLTAPLEYPTMVAVLQKCKLVLTDSGGIQEEAPALGKPVLVIRETTERPEAITAGVAELVGTNPTRVIARTRELLNDMEQYRKMAVGSSPYGDGEAAIRIGDILGKNLAGVTESLATTESFQYKFSK